jgi:glycine/D-amino acid oxidase-like deaminating enzyme
MARKHTILAVLLLSAAPAMASPGRGTQRRPPPPDDAAPRELLDLRAKLLGAGKKAAFEQVGQFRPLCDADGYPLVGNLANKPNVYQPSQFCADVRKAGK